jgi:hypothetical protein
MRNPPEQEPLYALAARCISRLAKWPDGRMAGAEGGVAPPAEDAPAAPFSQIIGFVSEPCEAAPNVPPGDEKANQSGPRSPRPSASNP